MRALVSAALVLCACQVSPHIDLHLDQTVASECGAHAVAGNPAPPMTCQQMTLDCADHIEFLVHRIGANGAVGDTATSRCLTVAELGHPANLCELFARPEPQTLIDSLPAGAPFIFQMRALELLDSAAGCDAVDPSPLQVFLAASDPIVVDGASHSAALHLTHCGSCVNLPTIVRDGGAAQDAGVVRDAFAFTDGMAGPADMAASNDMHVPSDMATPHDLPASDAFSASDMGTAQQDIAEASPDFAVPPDFATPDLSMSLADLGPSLCPPNEHAGPPGGARCCPNLDPATCPQPGTHCADGTVALLPPGGCCAECD